MYNGIPGLGVVLKCYLQTAARCQAEGIRTGKVV